MEESFGTRLKILRMEKGMGQIELSEALKVSRGIISLWENDLREPKLSNLVTIAQYFGVSIDFLAGIVDC